MMEGSEWIAATPSWTKLETRSTSFPHTRNRLQDDTTSWSRIGRRGEKSRTKMMLPERSGSVPTYSAISTSHRNTAKSAEGSPSDLFPSQQRRTVTAIVRPTPVLTLAMLKLDEYLPNFCECLKEPTFGNAKKAVQLLDTVIAGSPSGRSFSTPRNSPAPMTGSPGSIKSSPSRSPIASWFIGSSHQTESGSNQSNGPMSTMALEGEWDTFVNPLNLFAGLEAIYASLAHASPDRVVAHNLFRLYQQAKEDLNHLRGILCDPFLPASTAETDDSTSTPLDAGTKPSAASSLATLNSYREKASAVGMSLDAIQSICQCRCQLIRHQLTLWNTTDSLDFDDAASLFQTILPPIPADRASYASTIVDSTVAELEAWFRLMDLASSLCKCRFMESVTNAQRVKLSLMHLTTNTTCVGQWMRKLLQQLISLFPIFFDRVEASAPSLYGFEKTTAVDAPPVTDPKLGPSLQDIVRTKLTEFLRLEERSGPPMAIAVVFHSATSLTGSFNLNLDQGFSSSSMMGDDNVVKPKSVSDNQNALLRWPAVFLRSTAHQAISPSNRMGLKKSIGRREQRLGSTALVDGDTQSSTWPYSSWAHLVSALLSRGVIAPDSGTPSERFHWAQADKETSFLACEINHSMWLVLMIGAEDDNRWHRRRSSILAYEDLKESFDDLAALLRMNEWFKPSQALEIRRKVMESRAQQNMDLANNDLNSDRAWDDESTIDLIYSFKESFGLRAPRKKKSAKVSYGIRYGKGREENSPQRESGIIGVSNRQHALSVNAFFLGSDLMHAIATD